MKNRCVPFCHLVFRVAAGGQASKLPRTGEFHRFSLSGKGLPKASPISLQKRPQFPSRRRPPRSATSSVATRRISKGGRTTVPRRGRPSVVPREWAVTRPTPGGYTTRTATSTSGAWTGTTQNSPAASIRTCMRPKPRRGCAGVAVGPTRAGLAGPPFGCGSNRSDATTISAFASSPFSRSQREAECEWRHIWINWRHYLNEFAPLLFKLEDDSYFVKRKHPDSRINRSHTVSRGGNSESRSRDLRFRI
jgi:hypothetical protein